MPAKWEPPPKPRRMPAKWDSQPKRWRVRGTATDGLTVTLGRYETAEEAHAECRRLTEQGGYRGLVVQPIEPKPDPEAPESNPK